MYFLFKKTWYKFCYYYFVLNCYFELSIMKKLIITSILMTLFVTGTALVAQNNNQDYLGLPGDNLNLFAVMKLFQQSKTLEEFEKNLNDPENNINNLDLNGDNLVDYIKVFDDVDGDVHNIVLQVAVSPKENQDVAVFTVQRFDNGQVQIQLTGDEQLYGKNYIVEPIFDNETRGETPNPGYTGNSITYVRTTPVEIASWPVVRFIFLPSYTVWHSSWYWGYYPTYWHSWHPFSWNYYYGYHYNWNRDYYEHYRRWDYHRYSRWNDFYYTGRRSYSRDVNYRIERGEYKTTYSHPEQRKEGEERFAKMHSDEYRRSSSNSSMSNSTPRPDQRSNNTVKTNYNNFNNSRRSTTTVTNRTNNEKPVVYNPGTERKSTSTVTNRSINGKPLVNNPATERKSTTAEPNRSINGKPLYNNTGTERKSTSNVSNRSVSNPSSGQNAGMNRSNNSQKSNSVNSAHRGNENKTKSETVAKKDNKKTDSNNKDNKDPNHRR